MKIIKNSLIYFLIGAIIINISKFFYNKEDYYFDSKETLMYGIITMVVFIIMDYGRNTSKSQSK